MGYITHVTGSMLIEPPLEWSEITGTPFAPIRLEHADLDVCLEIAEERVDTAEGELIRRTGVALRFREQDEYRARDLLRHVQLAADAFPGHRFHGRFDCEGEESSDIWRVVIRDGRAVRIEPRIVWPAEDGEAR